MKILRGLLIISLVLLVACSAFYFFWLSPRYVVPILMYHRFGYDKSTLFVTPENFRRQMSYLKQNGYNVISLDELVKGIKSGRELGRNSVVITIDDGYKDNYTYAYPVLKEFSFPATIFIIANYIGSKPDFLNWDEVRIMHDNGIDFGCHTKNHVYIPDVKDSQTLWEETAGCRKLVEGRLGKGVDYFCYPFGGFTEEAKTVLKQAGYQGACTTRRGFAELNKDVYELKRVKVTNSDTTRPFNFRAKLSGFYNVFRSRRRGY